MNPVVHVLRRMGGRATTLLPFSLAIGLLFQNLSAAARPLLWPLAVVLLMLTLALVMTAGTWPFLDRRDALTAGYCAGGRHNALLMAVRPASADADNFLFIAAVQFPLYLMPTLLEPLYRRLLPR